MAEVKFRRRFDCLVKKREKNATSLEAVGLLGNCLLGREGDQVCGAIKFAGRFQMCGSARPADFAFIHEFHGDVL